MATPQLNLDKDKVEANLKTKVTTFVLSAFFAVDVFFWLAGFLGTISILN